MFLIWFVNVTIGEHEPLVQISVNPVTCRLLREPKFRISLKRHIEDFKKDRDEPCRVMNLSMIFRQRELKRSINELGSHAGRLPAALNKRVIKEQRR